LRLYLDVDGTLLRRSAQAALAPAMDLRLFLEWATSTYRCVWLTSRDRDGGDGSIRAVFRQAIGLGTEFDSIDRLLARVEPSRWGGFKAQAIDFSEPFLWLDDAPEEESLDLLDSYGVSDSWIPVALDQRPDDLRRVMTLLQRRVA
jgi:hypothetical protein